MDGDRPGRAGPDRATLPGQGRADARLTRVTTTGGDDRASLSTGQLSQDLRRARDGRAAGGRAPGPHRVLSHRRGRPGRYRHADGSLRTVTCRRDRGGRGRSEEHTSELQSLAYLVCRLLLVKKKNK